MGHAPAHNKLAKARLIKDNGAVAAGTVLRLPCPRGVERTHALDGVTVGVACALLVAVASVVVVVKHRRRWLAVADEPAGALVSVRLDEHAPALLQLSATTHGLKRKKRHGFNESSGIRSVQRLTAACTGDFRTFRPPSGWSCGQAITD